MDRRQRSEKLFQGDGAGTRRAAVALRHVHIFQVIALSDHPARKALFLEVHMLCLEMHEDVVDADQLDDIHRLSTPPSQLAILPQPVPLLN